MTVPNIISLMRIIIAPIFYILMVSGHSELLRLGIFLYIIGAISDYLDGWLARKFDVITSLGKFVDPLADKFLTTAAFLVFFKFGIIPFWMVIVILVRDFGTTFLRIYTDKFGIEIKTSYSAKVKTFLQMLFIAFILIALYLENSLLLGMTEEFYHNLIYSDITYYTMLFLVVITLWTGIEYYFAIRKSLKLR